MRIIKRRVISVPSPSGHFSWISSCTLVNGTKYTFMPPPYWVPLPTATSIPRLLARSSVGSPSSSTISYGTALKVRSSARIAAR